MDFSALMDGVDRSVRQVLGGPVTYTPSAGSPVEVRGVFDASYIRVDAGHAGVSSVGPAVFLKLADLPSDPAEDFDATVTIAGVVYSVHEIQPDAFGGVRLLLHRV